MKSRNFYGLLICCPDRRSTAHSGIHALTLRLWDKDDEKQAVSSVLYLKMYLREWPLALNAFVLWDTVGLYVDAEGSRLPLLDNHHLQPLENMDLLIESDGALDQRIVAANERLDFEIKLVQSAIDRWASCIVGEFEFERVGICELAFRARQRFFFILAAEELLFALTEPEPEKSLEQLWYLSDFNVSTNGLFVDNDRLRNPAAKYWFRTFLTSQSAASGDVGFVVTIFGLAEKTSSCVPSSAEPTNGNEHRGKFNGKVTVRISGIAK